MSYRDTRIMISKKVSFIKVVSDSDGYKKRPPRFKLRIAYAKNFPALSIAHTSFANKNDGREREREPGRDGKCDEIELFICHNISCITRENSKAHHSPSSTSKIRKSTFDFFFFSLLRDH